MAALITTEKYCFVMLGMRYIFSKGLRKLLSQKQAKLSLITYSTMIWPSMKKYGEIMGSTKSQMDKSMALVYDGTGMRRR